MADCGGRASWAGCAWALDVVHRDPSPRTGEGTLVIGVLLVGGVMSGVVMPVVGAMSVVVVIVVVDVMLIADGGSRGRDDLAPLPAVIEVVERWADDADSGERTVPGRGAASLRAGRG